MLPPSLLVIDLTRRILQDGGALGSPEYASDQVTSSEACPLSPSVPSSMPNTSPCYPFTRAQAPSSSNYDVTSSGVNDQVGNHTQQYGFHAFEQITATGQFV